VALAARYGYDALRARCRPRTSPTRCTALGRPPTPTPEVPHPCTSSAARSRRRRRARGAGRTQGSPPPLDNRRHRAGGRFGARGCFPGRGPRARRAHRKRRRLPLRPVLPLAAVGPDWAVVGRRYVGAGRGYLVGDPRSTAVDLDWPGAARSRRRSGNPRKGRVPRCTPRERAPAPLKSLQKDVDRPLRASSLGAAPARAATVRRMERAEAARDFGAERLELRSSTARRRCS
jgi:hypothetical protein